MTKEYSKNILQHILRYLVVMNWIKADDWNNNRMTSHTSDLTQSYRTETVYTFKSQLLWLEVINRNKSRKWQKTAEHTSSAERKR